MRLFCFIIVVTCILIAGGILLIDLWKIVDWSEYHYRIFWTCGVVGLSAFLIGIAQQALLDRKDGAA
jgi:hypothetical protein